MTKIIIFDSDIKGYRNATSAERQNGLFQGFVGGKIAITSSNFGLGDYHDF